MRGIDMDDSLKEYCFELFRKGNKENDVLKALKEEKGVDASFMDIRLLRADFEALEGTVGDDKPAGFEEPNADETASSGGAQGIHIDNVTRPGMAMSGSATLKSGARIKWGLDQMGRVAVQPDDGSSEPTQEDMAEFQQALVNKIRGG